MALGPDEALVVPPSPQAADDAAAQERVGPRLPRLAAAAAVGVLGVFGGGFATGLQWAADRDAPNPAPTPVALPFVQYASGADVGMPDVRGLTLEAARSVLADSGVPASAVVATAQPWAGAPGVVVEQTPAFGVQRPQRVTLGVSAPAKVPPVVGQDEVSARRALEDLGTRVVLQRRYVVGATAGTVLALQPAAGAALPEKTTVTVADAPGALFLADLRPLESRCGSGATRLDATDHEHSLTCRAGESTSPATTVFLVDRAGVRLEGVVGVPDVAGPDDAGVVTLVGDGRVLATVRAAYGRTAPLVADVTGVLRLEVRVTGSAGATVALGDLQLVGSPEAVDRLRARG